MAKNAFSNWTEEEKPSFTSHYIDLHEQIFGKFREMKLADDRYK